MRGVDQRGLDPRRMVTKAHGCDASLAAATGELECVRVGDQPFLRNRDRHVPSRARAASFPCSVRRSEGHRQNRGWIHRRQVGSPCAGAGARVVEPASRRTRDELAAGRTTEGTQDDLTVGVNMQDVVEARYIGEHTIWIRFEDGTAGEVDLSGELVGGVFEPLRDQSYFKEFRVNVETGTIEWPNRADFAPEFLYDKVRVAV